MYSTKDLPSESASSGGISMNSSRQLQHIRMLIQDQHEYYRWYMREGKDLRDRLMFNTGTESANIEELGQYSSIRLR